MQALILGGMGFIGKNLIKNGLTEFEKVVVCDISIAEDYTHENIFFLRVDCTDNAALDLIFQKFEFTHLFHLISTTGPRSSNENILYDIQTNLMTAVGLLDLCVAYAIKRVIFLSSGGTVYGQNSESLVDELAPTNPICSYGIVKLAIEKYLWMYHKLHGLTFVALRASNPYGIGQIPSKGIGAIAVFANKILSNEPIEIWGDGTVVRDYIAIDDLVSLLTISALSTKTGVFNAGSGKGTSLNNIIKIIEDATGLIADVEYKPARSFDVQNIILDCNLAKGTFNWKIDYGIELGIKKYITDLGFRLKC